MATTETVATGREMANHCSHDKGGSMAARPMRFWGDEMGEACPPMLDARAIAIYRTRRFSLNLVDSPRPLTTTHDKTSRERRLGR